MTSGDKRRTVARPLVRSLLVDITNAPALVDRLPDDAPLRDHGIGSGDLLRLVAGIEERFGVEVTVDDADRLLTLADAERLVERLGSASFPL